MFYLLQPSLIAGFFLFLKFKIYATKDEIMTNYLISLTAFVTLGILISIVYVILLNIGKRK